MISKETNKKLQSPIPTVKFPESKMQVVSPSKEKLVYLDNYFLCESKYYKWEENEGRPLPGSSPHICARESVLKMLLEAEKLIPKGYRFKVYDAYRPIAVQQALWDYFRAKKVEENPNKNPEEIDKLTAFCVSFPSYYILEPSLHNTGGAVDLTIVDPSGKELDMGCKFDEFTDKAWTNHFECYEDNEGVRNNRRMLYNAMISVGFTNLPSEWWHFDYGNDKWAWFHHTSPFYAGILDAKVKDSAPYRNSKKVQEIDSMQQEYVDNMDKMEKICKSIAMSLALEQKEYSSCYAKDEKV